MQRFSRFAAAAFAVLTLAVGIASAHGDTAAGDYIVTFGWRNEPAYAGQFNGPEVILSLHDDSVPFPTDVPVELQAEVTFGPATITVFFRQERQEPGHFIADLIPALPGDYVFRVTGTIGDTPVDLTFDSADGQFSSVEPLESIVFPAPETSLAALLARIAAFEERLAALESE